MKKFPIIRQSKLIFVVSLIFCQFGIHSETPNYKKFDHDYQIAELQNKHKSLEEKFISMTMEKNKRIQELEKTLELTSLHKDMEILNQKRQMAEILRENEKLKSKHSYRDLMKTNLKLTSEMRNTHEFNQHQEQMIVFQIPSSSFSPRPLKNQNSENLGRRPASLAP